MIMNGITNDFIAFTFYFYILDEGSVLKFFIIEPLFTSEVKIRMCYFAWKSVVSVFLVDKIKKLFTLYSQFGNTAVREFPDWCPGLFKQ